MNKKVRLAGILQLAASTIIPDIAQGSGVELYKSKC